MKRAAVAACILFLLACAHATSTFEECAAAHDAIPMCTVVAKADLYDGREVTVGLHHQDTPHYGLIYAPECRVYAQPAFADRIEGDRQFKAALRRSPISSAEVVVRAVFHRAKPEEVFGPAGVPYKFAIEACFCARSDLRRD